MAEPPVVLEVTAPYPGLSPFEPHEAEIFFGREQHVDRLLEILQRERFLAVIGPSGSGKSSLVRAGMVPALTAGWLGTGSDWRMVVMRPGDHPFRALARGLLASTAFGAELGSEPTGAGAEGREPEALGSHLALVEAELRRGPLGLVHLLDDVYARPSGQDRPNVLVLVDQFEEIFRYSGGAGAAADEATGFVDLLLASRSEARARVYVALTMRTDFLGHCVRFLDLPEAINRSQYLTPRLTRRQLEAAVTGPARVFGGDVDARVATQAINAVADDPDQLPILQHALARMWESAVRRDPGAPVITWDDLTTTGGIAEALALHADSVWDALTPEQQRLAEALFRAITERGLDAGERDIRHPMPLAEIAQVVGRPWPELVPVVEAFSRQRVDFLTHTRPLDGATRIDISHEALIRQWPRLLAWVADEADRARDYRRWRERALDRSRGGELLTGADLALATEWRAGRDGWQPTVGWAERYALAPDEDAGEEYEQTLAYIAESDASERARRQAEEAAARRKQELDQQRLEAEKRAAEAQAEVERQRAAAERERAEASMRERRLAEALARRSKRWSLVATAIAAVAIALAVSTFISWQHSQAAMERAREAQYEAVAGKLVAQSRAVLSGHTRDSTDIALLLAVAGYRLRPDNEAYGGLQYVLEAAPRMSKVISFPDRVVAMSPDGRIAVTAQDTGVQLWDAATGDPRGAPLGGHSAQVQAVAFSPDGKTLVSGSADRKLRVWDVATGQPRGAPLLGHSGRVMSVAFSGDGGVLASGDYDGALRLWDADTGQPRGALLRATAVRAHPVRIVALSPDGRTLASASADRELQLWDVATGQPRGAPLHGRNDPVRAAAFSPDGRTLASGSDSGVVRLWDAATRQPRGEPRRGHSDWVTIVAFSPDGTTLVSGSDDGTLRLWEAGTGRPLGTPILGHTGAVRSLAFADGGKTLVSGSDDRTLRVWDASRVHRHGEPLPGQNGPVMSVAFSPDGKTLVSATSEGTLHFWDARTARPVGAPLRGHPGVATTVAFSPDGKTLVSGGADGPLMLAGFFLHRGAERPMSFGPSVDSPGADGTLQLWDAATGRPRGAPLQRLNGSVRSAAFSPDNKTLASAGDHGEPHRGLLRLWDAGTGQPRGEPLHGHADLVTSVAFSPDGRMLVSGSGDHTLRVWDGSTGQPLGTPLRGHTDAVTSVAFSHDGKTIASASVDDTLRLWDAASRQPRGASLRGHQGAVVGVAFSPDGTILVSAGADRALRLWDVATGRPRGAPLEGNTAAVMSVAFSPDGKTIASGSVDGTLRLWDAPAVWSDRVCAKLVRNLSHAAWKRYAGNLPYVEQCPGLPVPAD